MAKTEDVLRGTLDLMVLRALSWGPMHGYGVVQWIKRTTDGTLDIDDGALYPALHRLERRGWIGAEWGWSENNRRAKYYELTVEGRRQLRRELSSWTRFSEAVWKIVNATQRA
jgi:PadR family transcriptional regulator PadR